MRVDVNGVGIEYEVSGDGPPVVLLHVFPDSGRLWRHQVPALERLDGPGHWLQLEAPSEVNRLLIDFLAA